MNNPIFTIKDYKSFIKITLACFLILIAVINLFAQYRGAPVKKNRLIQALRSRQLQTGDIVTIIKSNGVDFELTETVKKSLIDAGARPEVIQAVANNPRLSSSNNMIAKGGKNNSRKKTAPTNYDDLLDQALYSYKDQKNPKAAVRILENAVKMSPANPAAYQMLGYIYLYELNDFAQAEKFMRESFANGGSAVFRVYHDDNGKFTGRCSGSLYISEDSLRFESDNNVHTFETTTVNIDKIKLDRETTRAWKKRSIYKIFLKIGTQEAKFRFSPLSGQLEESKMAERFVAASNSNKSSSNSER